MYKKLSELTLADVKKICNYHRQHNSCGECQVCGWLCCEQVIYWPIYLDTMIEIPD
jgi:hypothetical protein